MSFLPKSRKARTRLLLLSIIAPVVATTAATLVFYGSARFRSTIEPLLLTFASVTLLAIVSRLTRSRATATEAAG